MRTTAGIRELKANLSRYVRKAQRGAIILITDRGEVVAELHPVSAEVSRAQRPIFAERIERGEVTPPEKALTGWRLRAPRGSLSAKAIRQALDDVRGDKV